MGVKVGELPDGLIIDGKPEYDGRDFSSFGDSRIALACSVAGFLCQGKSTLDDDSPLVRDFPGFYTSIGSLSDKK
jgi:3-phosphoshikimate 1-carboxyvinyltransferase